MQDLNDSNICIIALLSFKNVCIKLFAKGWDKLFAKVQSLIFSLSSCQLRYLLYLLGGLQNLDVFLVLCYGHQIKLKAFSDG